MALIPDQAIDDQTELSSGAWRLYCFLARCRNQNSGKCNPSVSLTMTSIGVNRSSVYALRKELQEKGWAQFDGDFATNLYGFASPKNQTTSEENKQVTVQSTSRQSKKSDSPKNQTVAVENIGLAASPKNQTFRESKKSDFSVQKIRLAYKEEPANRTSKDIASLPAKPAISAKPADPFFEIFATAFERSAGCPYLHQKADFVQLAALRKKAKSTDWELTPERFETAVRNYFASEIGVFTLAALCTRFSTFFKSPLDRYGQPLGKSRSKAEQLYDRNMAAVEEASRMRRDREFIDAEVVNG